MSKLARFRASVEGRRLSHLAGLIASLLPSTHCSSLNYRSNLTGNMGIISAIAPNSDLAQNVFPPASLFDPQRDMPDLSGKVVLVTGGNR